MLEELEQKLSTLSHSEAAMHEIQSFCGAKKSAQLASIWNANGALVRAPIESEVAASSFGFNEPDDSFVLLQGDIISCESAYFVGERITGKPKYAVMNSSCDLVPNRASTSALLRISEIKRDEGKAKEKLATLLKFSRRDSMYIPPL